VADNGYTKNYQDGSSLTETQLDSAYKSLKLDISNTTQLTQGATAGHYLKCITPGSAAQFAAVPSATNNVIASRSANYTVTDTDNITTVLVTTGTAAITITLPTASDNNYRIITVKKVDSGTGTVIIDGEASETIDSTATKTLYSQWDAITVQCNSVNWFVSSIKLNSITNWTSYTPTFVAVGVTSNVEVFWRRVGDSIDVRGRAVAGTLSSSSLTITIPSGLTIDTTKLPAYKSILLGDFVRASTTSNAIAGTTAGPFCISYNATDKVYVSNNTNQNDIVFTDAGATLILGSTNGFTFRFNVPVTQYRFTE